MLTMPGVEHLKQKNTIEYVVNLKSSVLLVFFSNKCNLLIQFYRPTLAKEPAVETLNQQLIVFIYLSYLFYELIIFAHNYVTNCRIVKYHCLAVYS